MGGYFFYSDYVLNNEEWNSLCLQVQNGKFTRNITATEGVKELIVHDFWVGPGKVYIDIEEPIYGKVDFETSAKKYIYRGCTLLLCQFPVKSKRNFKYRYGQFKRKLTYLPLDYMMVPRIPLSILNPDHVRFFGRRKVPFIIVEADNLTEFSKVKWEWIHQAQSFSGIPIIYDGRNLNNKQKEIESTWEKITESFDIQTLREEISELPLSINTLRKTGISPFKGEFIENSSADYNLYELNQIPSIDEGDNFRYHKAIPVVTVMKGKVIKSNHLVEGQKGDGEFKQVSIPNHFLTS